MEEIPKPRELLAARTSAEVLFTLLRDWFEVPPHVTLDLRAVDSAVSELADPQLVMAMAMRKLQALHLLTTPGVRTTTDVVITVLQDLERALVQAPSMYLKTEAADTDWDAELAALGETTPPPARPDEPPIDREAFDDVATFRRHHGALRLAARAVFEHARDGEIRILV